MMWHPNSLKNITTTRELLELLSEHLRASEPQSPMNDGLITTINHLLWELCAGGEYRLEPDEWEDVFYSIFRSVLSSQSTTVCGIQLLWFTAEAYSKMIENGGKLSTGEGILIILKLLGFGWGTLKVRQTGKYWYLESPPAFIRMFGATVRVRLQTPDLALFEAFIDDA